MSSSFQRFKKSNKETAYANRESKINIHHKVILKGTKPWTRSGILLTSTGLRELDAILNNGHGQPLGTLIVIEEDRFLDYGSLMARYWCSEGIAHDHVIACCITKSPQNKLPNSFQNKDYEYEDNDITKEEIISFLQSLPLNLHNEKKQITQQLQDTIIEEDNEGLSIAWQYHTSIQNQRLGLNPVKKQQHRASNVFCHSYDLNQCPYHNAIPDVDFIDLMHSAKECYDTLINYVKKHSKNHVLRMLFIHPPSHAITALTSLLHYIKSNSLPIVLLVIHRPWRTITQHTNLIIQQNADVLLQVQGTCNQKSQNSSNYEAILKIIKCNTLGDYYGNWTKFTTFPAYTYKMKLNQRKLELQMLHIPPAGEEEDGGGGGLRSVKSSSCATASLDF